MQLVAVIDLLDAQVVHARRGERTAYAPVQSTLCEGAQPVIVANALAQLYAFEALYLADLNAIQGRGDNLDAIDEIARRVPLPLWIDAGIDGADALTALRDRGLGVPVIGSESIVELDFLADELAQDRPFVLSLDFRAGNFMGPEALLERAELWPQRILAMNLAHVGSGLGPDLPLIRALHSRAPSNSLFASGGVRSASDLAACANAGACGALLATSLHDGSLAPWLARQASLGTANG